MNPRREKLTSLSQLSITPNGQDHVHRLSGKRIRPRFSPQPGSPSFQHSSVNCSCKGKSACVCVWVYVCVHGGGRVKIAYNDRFRDLKTIRAGGRDHLLSAVSSKDCSFVFRHSARLHHRHPLHQEPCSDL